MANKKISELDQTLNLSDQADFPLSQDNGGEPTTFRAKLTQIATKIAEAITFSNLKTGNKQLVSAVNQTISNLADDFNTTAGSTYAKDDCVLYNGVLYQCINNSGTTSGTFIDADWTAIKAVDVGSGGGGGGGAGGHTIVDDAGTSLTQRTNLQFLGAYSEDNATDDTTEVNIVREMTKAEFDELTEEEKTGLINITDITGGNDDRFQPVIYSTEEREIGVWTDGKPIYEKTFDLGSDINIDYTSWTETSASWQTLNVDRLVGAEGSTSSGGTFAGTLLASKKSTGNIEIQTPRNGTATGVRYLTVRYTKTTDQAGSGQWTPQGVPAHHYSEDEQVVGTWVDGSTIYEKTFVFSGGLVCSAYTWAETTIDVDFDKVIQSEGISDGIANVSIIAAKTSNGKLQIMNLRNTTVGVGSATIRYTKSA